MLDKKGKELMISSDCYRTHVPGDANVFKNSHSQRYFEWPCGCTQVHGCFPETVQRGSHTVKQARGVKLSEFEKGLFKSEFD